MSPGEAVKTANFLVKPTHRRDPMTWPHMRIFLRGRRLTRRGRSAKVVDEVALFFAVSSREHMVTDLQLSDIEIRDNAKPPEKILQFAPRSYHCGSPC
jgi:hypothetical protein